MKKIKLIRKNKIRRDTKIDRIEDGIVYYKEKGIKVHSLSTKRKMSKARKGRKVQPRAGTSKKPKNLFEQIKYDFKGVTLSKSNAQKINSFLKSEREKLDIESEECKKDGYYLDYHQNIYSNMELSLLGGSEILFDSKGKRTNEFADDIEKSVDLERLTKNIQRECVELEEDGYSEEYIEAYRDIETFINDIETIYKTSGDIKEKIVRKYIEEKNYEKILGKDYY